MSRRRSLLFISVLVLVGAGASFVVGLIGSDLSSVYASMVLSFAAAALRVLDTMNPEPSAELAPDSRRIRRVSGASSAGKRVQ